MRRTLLVRRSRLYGSRGYARPRMLAVGDPIPDVTVWTAPNEPARLSEVLAGGPALVFFYLFDGSGT